MTDLDTSTGKGELLEQAAELARFLVETHELVLGVPCPLDEERAASEMVEIICRMQAPAERLRSALTFAIEAHRARDEPLDGLRFLRQFAFRDETEVRKIVQEALRGERVVTRRHETPMGEEDLVEGFLRYLKVEEGKSEHTVRSYGESLEALRGFLAPRRIKLREVVRADLIDFKGALFERGNSAKTVNVRLAAVGSFYRYLLMRHEIERDPSQNVRRLPEQHRKMSVLSAAEVERMIDAFDTDTKCGARNHCLVVLLFATAGRIGEVTGLRLPDVDLEGGAVTFRERKNKHDNRVCLAEPAVGVLGRFIEEVRPWFAERANPGCEDLVFLSTQGNPFNRSNVSRMLKKVAREAGVEKHVSSHTFRRTVATIMANNDMPAELIKTFLGHQSVDTTLRNYVAYSDAAQRKAIDEFHPLSEQAGCKWRGPARRRILRRDQG